MSPNSRIYFGIVSGAPSAAQWLSGAGAPNPILGSIGNFYLDTSVSDIYEKTGAAIWTLRGNIAGYMVKSHSVELAYNSDISLDFLNLKSGDYVFAVEVRIETPWDVSGSTLKIGVTGNLDKYLQTSDVNLYAAGGSQFSKVSNLKLTANETLKATYTYGFLDGAGAAKIIVYYATPAVSVFPVAPYLNKGFYSGGWNSVAQYLNVTEAIIFNNDTAAMITRGNLDVSRSRCAGVNSSLAGYISGNLTGFPGLAVVTSSKLSFSSETALMSVAGNLSIFRAKNGACESSTKGYFPGGTDLNDIAYYSSCDGLDFANDTLAMTAKGNLVVARKNFAGHSSPLFGYFSGGIVTGPAFTATTDRIDFSNDTLAMLSRGSLSMALDTCCGYNTDLFGYAGRNNAQIDRMDYNNDTNVMVFVASLVLGRYDQAATNSNAFGYLAGGFFTGPTYYTTCEGHDFSNDTAPLVTKGSLLTARARMASFQSGYR